MVRYGLRRLIPLVTLAGAAMLSPCRPGGPEAPVYEVPGGMPAQGRLILRQTYGCGACHVIPGVPGARGAVGPPLTSFAGRTVIAGRLPNTPENLIRWIMNPQAVDPLTAMPDVGVTEADARDIAAYLYTLR
ncbi:MAG: c-type cytochrome [Chloroflexota bacterium]